jgi:SAM-dependent methyltransferase
MRSIVELDAQFYPNYVGVPQRLDQAVRRHLRLDHVVLDAGAGSGRAFTHDYKNHSRLLIGVDRSAEITGNRLLDVAVLADLTQLPFRQEVFDLVLAKCLFEHLDRPVEVLRELKRVLRQGGHIVFHTPNRFHYVALTARVLPHRFHVWFNTKRGAQEHRFETFYRANDRRTLQRLASRAGLRVTELELFEPKPVYLFFHPVAYRAGIAYQRLVARHDWLAGVRCSLIGVLEAA